MKINIEKAKKISITILEELVKFADEGVELITMSDLRRNLNYVEGDPRRISNNIKSLERRGYIEISPISNSVRLTDKGQIRLIEKSTVETIDGKWRMLSFDIPEEFRNKRAQFRRSIKRIGFKQVQKSLWTCPFVKADKVDLIIKELELEKFVAYLLIEKTDIENHLKTLFRLELSALK